MSKEELWQNYRGEFLFYWNWEGGGYNTEWAQDPEHLKTVIVEMFGEDLKPDWSTVRPITRTEWRAIEYNAALYYN